MLMSHILDLNISKKNISETFRISQVTIMKTYRKIFPYRKVLINDFSCQKIINIMKKKEESMKKSKEDAMKKSKEDAMKKSKELIDSESDNLFNLNIKKEDYLNISESPIKDIKKKKSKKKSLINRYI